MSGRRRALLLIAIWSVPAWLMVAEPRTLAHLAGAPASPLRASIPPLIQWYLWALITPAVLWLNQRYPLNRFPIAPRSIAVHVLGILGTSAVHGVVYSATLLVLGLRRSPGPFWPLTFRMSIGLFPLDAVLYAAVVAAGAALDFARRLGEREAAAARLGEQLARAQLDGIRARIHPHFLFNALHSVAALVRSGEREDAVRIVSDLSDLLREVLAQDTPDLVPLSQELGFVRRYLAIESIRFSDRLRVEWSVDDAIMDAEVPPLLVQALVENAVRHGISRSGTAGRLQIDVREDRGMVEIVVTDDGPGLRAAGPASGGTGFGIEAARQRLRALLGDRADVRLEAGPKGGTVARVRMPMRRQQDAATPMIASAS